MTIKAIIACDRKGGIAKNAILPWPKNNEDLSYFKSNTVNNVVVMGAGTWLSLDMPVPLPNRINVVVTSKELMPKPDITINAISTDYIKDKIKEIEEHNPDKTVWIIGGATLLDSMLDIVGELHLTMFKKIYDCDTFINIDRIFENFKIEKYILCDSHDRMIMHRHTT